MKIITALKITIISLLLVIMMKSSKEGLQCVVNYKYLHYPLSDKLMIRDHKGVIDCTNKMFSEYCQCY
jgi:hypothetical protein